MNSVIITGATSGIGFECAMHTARIAPNEQIIIACRNLESGRNVVQSIERKTGHKNLLCLLLDLDSLESIRNFKEQFSKNENPCIIALINNVGIQNIGKTQFTKEGYESTFGVNHLASFYLTLLLLPFMDNNASITFTASGVHDKTNIRVNAFDPGLVPGTGLARTYSPLLRFVWKNVFPLLKYFVRNVNSPQDSGKRLANLAYSEKYRENKGKYFEGTKEIKSSTDSYNRDFQQMLWTTSVQFLGIKQQETSVTLA
ncbi:MAG: SDR family NAD(P)-dependent oxidoreductase [Chitinophagaceae bacterium]